MMTTAGTTLDSNTDLSRPTARTWRPLRVLNLYRLGLGSLFFGLAASGDPPFPLAATNEPLFYYTSFVYLAYGVVCLITAENRLAPFRAQLYTQVTADVVAVTLLMHASGGVTSGLGMLLVVSVANVAIITAGRTASFFAALASIALLLEQAYSHLATSSAAVSYPHAGMLGITLFATAALAQVLARRASESEKLAVQRGVDLANMAQLTGFVIEHMQTGIVAVEKNGHLLLTNAVARRLLSLEGDERAPDLASICPGLWERLQEWRGDHAVKADPLQLADVEHQLLPRFMPVGPEGAGGTLIFLEDASLASRQVQQLKLAALGRLTASIAHEIRNPLGAISHAGQLLAESVAIEAGDRRMVDIIIGQAARVNTIVENVLQLGRKQASRAHTLELAPWIERFAAQFVEIKGLDKSEFRFRVEPNTIKVQFDASHLEQIVTNLCDNAERHSRGIERRPRVEITAGVNRKGRPFLEVRDFGTGIPAEQQDRLFEPFFTTAVGGTGLGLYLSRELAQCNRAELMYWPVEDGDGCRFRLLFPAG